MEDHVLATFTRPTEARAAAQRVERELGCPVRLGDTDDVLDALALGQRAEMDDSGPALPAGVMSGPFARGAALWSLVGALAGAVLTLPLGLLVQAGDLPRWQLAGLLMLVGAFAGGSVGFVLGAGRQAVKEGETTPEDPTAVIRVDTPPERADDAIRVLVASGARSTRLVDAPVHRPPASDVETPRPARRADRYETGPGSDDVRRRPLSSQADYDAGFGSDVR
jgi:hypothetical protein